MRPLRLKMNKQLVAEAKRPPRWCRLSLDIVVEGAVRTIRALPVTAVQAGNPKLGSERLLNLRIGAPQPTYSRRSDFELLLSIHQADRASPHPPTPHRAANKPELMHHQ